MTVKPGALRRFAKSRSAVLALLCAALAVYFNIASGGEYLQWTNIRVILNTMLIGAYLTCGAAFLMITGCLDLSASQTGAFGGVIFAKLLAVGMPFPFAAIVALACAALVGAVNAVLVQEVKIQSFISTLAMSYIVMGTTLVISHGTATPVKNSFVVWLCSYKLGGEVPLTLVITAAIMLVYGVALAKSRFGRGVYMIGGNAVAAGLSGLSPRKTHYILFCNNAMLCAVAGMLQVGKLRVSSAGSVSFGPFAGITCAILGGVSFGGGAGSIGGAMLGLLLLNGVSNGLALTKAPPYLQSVLSGGLLLIALSSEVFTARRRRLRDTKIGRVTG